ncbi:hypothetical protein [Rhizobium rhizoryzae]|uniref:Uncharacterized protein n=1 Tax=Rhizobium rhizoryzae TaxID=451876 RepID=A0A7W6LMB7_9HYPH|nr:hypothetical protein [Rhizobium rhizoryzae]MBB4146048.1 hypothetical protein [Rhizobium rhizoryzae]
MRRVAAAAVLSFAGLVQAYAAEQMTRACEAAIKSRLLTPESFKLLDTEEYSRPISREDYAQELGKGIDSANVRKAKLAIFDARGGTAEYKRLTIRFEAMDPRNKPVKALTVCEATLIGDDQPEPDQVKLDGKDRTDWLIHGAR